MRLYNATVETEQDGRLSVNVCASGKAEAARVAGDRLCGEGYDGVRVVAVRDMGGAGCYGYGQTLICGPAN